MAGSEETGLRELYYTVFTLPSSNARCLIYEVLSLSIELVVTQKEAHTVNTMCLLKIGLEHNKITNEAIDHPIDLCKSKGCIRFVVRMRVETVYIGSRIRGVAGSRSCSALCVEWVAIMKSLKSPWIASAITLSYVLQLSYGFFQGDFFDNVKFAIVSRLSIMIDEKIPDIHSRERIGRGRGATWQQTRIGD